jgi:hypothetical protein
MTRASRSTSEESCASHSARTPLGALRRASHSRAVLGAAPVARAMSRSERWPVSWTWIASCAKVRLTYGSLASCRRDVGRILASSGTDERMQSGAARIRVQQTRARSAQLEDVVEPITSNGLGYLTLLAATPDRNKKGWGSSAPPSSDDPSP